MPDKFTPMSAELHRYAVEHSDRDELLRRLDQETESETGQRAVMMTAPEQAAMMGLLVRAIGARRALELGTFTGYGSIAIARSLPEDGTLITCDVSDAYTAIAKRYWEEAGLTERIDLRLGAATETLAAMSADDPFDFIFIDADKPSYPTYYEESLRLLRQDGLLLIDNVFRGGDVLDPRADDDGARAIRQLNERIAADSRVTSAMLGISDGVTLALKL